MAYDKNILYKGGLVMDVIDNAVGRLQVEVFGGSVALPINGARVEVTDNNGNVVTEVFTNESGKTPNIELPAPPKQLSLEPEDEVQPYSTYNVRVSADGFEDFEANGVQILADSIAIQRAMLSPSQEEIINIPPSTLWGDYPSKIPEEEEKEIPTESGFVVLDQVVIPEYIVVHEGGPNSSGENYYVPFKDYIKNVASSEIYSTWPDAAIRANVLAIISYTLNRVYTEWYRNRGKNFTITNSTAYDQSFEYGRNIYEEISVIVDEMFNTYIKRFGSDQPLFAQYCDGRKVSCPGWMTQWGSAELAEQGYSTIDILRYFYGDDIYLEQAQKVSGVPVSYPGEPLSVGSSGEDVRTIQNQLNTISRTYSAIPTLRVDGVYGESTAEAVEVFQGIFNLPQTGIVDLATWYQISQLYVAIAKLAQL